MAEQENILTNAEIWDDSSLIDSWNEALQEYKKYHSIHAKRGNLKEIQPAKQTSSATADESDDRPQELAPDQRNQEGHPTIPIQGLPQALVGSIRDENLKNLLMSWYYAGYYTGLFEGQQQGQGEKTTASES